MIDSIERKKQIKIFWDQKPCGTFGNIPDEPGLDYFEKLRFRRYKLEPFIKKMARFNDWRGKRVLEIGCGVGTDALEFVKSGALYTGIDVSSKTVELAKKNFELSGFSSQNIILADAENLPFKNGSFDFVYSWGVIHHTPNMNLAISEISRVLKEDGKFCIMLYNINSLVGLQLYILRGLLKLKPFLSFKELFSRYHESPGTKALTNSEASELFADFENLKIKNIVTPYDLRITHNIYLPSVFKIFVPASFGFFKIITGEKA